VKHALTPLLAVAVAVALPGCEQGGESGDAHGHEDGEGSDHDHGDDADHAHDDGDGDGHDHDAGASDGVIAGFTEVGAEQKVGYLRLKLHDDKGDLEVWLARDAELSQPFDVPLDTTVTVTFTDKDGRTATLRVRDRDQNEDEEGQPTVRGGETNYFIFPGDTGEDASWLPGAEFLATVKVTFSAGGEEYTTPRFVLRPPRPKASPSPENLLREVAPRIPDRGDRGRPKAKTAGPVRLRPRGVGRRPARCRPRAPPPGRGSPREAG